MAITISVQLDDAEQALVQEAATKFAPNAPTDQILEWIQRQCKAGLRSAVLELWERQAEEDAAELNATRRQRAERDFPAVAP